MDVGLSDLVMFDDGGNTTESRLEGREPVGRLLRHVQKHLNAVCRPLHICCWLSEPVEPGCIMVC